MPENEGPGQVLFYEWRCIARGLANEPYLGNVIGGTIEFETSGWADGEPRFWHVDGRGARCATGKLGYPADATMKMTVKAAAPPNLALAVALALALTLVLSFP